MNKTRKTKEKELDPLYVIFEQHLYNFPDSNTDRRTFIARIVKDYFQFLRRRSVAIPAHMENAVAEEVGHQVNQMLVKKIYGCLTIDDYLKDVDPGMKQRARSRYSKLRTG